jgi:hypothetical protein
MDQRQKDKIIEIVEKAISVNEKLLDEEKAFIRDLFADKDATLLEHTNEILSELSRKESLYLGASKSILKKINEELE